VQFPTAERLDNFQTSPSFASAIVASTIHSSPASAMDLGARVPLVSWQGSAAIRALNFSSDACADAALASFSDVRESFANEGWHVPLLLQRRCKKWG
jgi:hypothetical protein